MTLIQYSLKNRAHPVAGMNAYAKIKRIFGWQVSLGFRFTYITDKTKDWIDSHNSFSLEDITNHYGKDAETTLKTVILVLWNTGILDVL